MKRSFKVIRSSHDYFNVGQRVVLQSQTQHTMTIVPVSWRGNPTGDVIQMSNVDFRAVVQNGRQMLDLLGKVNAFNMDVQLGLK